MLRRLARGLLVEYVRPTHAHPPIGVTNLQARQWAKSLRKMAKVEHFHLGGSVVSLRAWVAYDCAITW